MIAQTLLMMGLAALGEGEAVNAPKIAAARAWAAPVPKTVAVNNGTRVWVHTSAGLPLAHVAVTVNAGSLSEPDAKAGLAALTASAVEEGGAGARAPSEVVDAFDALGTTLHVMTRPDGVIFSFSVLSSRVDQAVALLFDVLTKPRFDATAFESVKQRRIAQITADLDDPRQVGTSQLAFAMYGNSPRGHDLNGSLDSVKALTLDEVKAFYTSHYVPSEVTVTLVGDVTVEGAQKLLNSVMPKPWSNVKAAPRPAEVAAAAPSWVAIDKPGAAQTVVAFGRQGFAVSDPVVPALRVASTVLGGSFTSRLMQRLREKSGYTYGIGAGSSNNRTGGSVFVNSSVKTEVTAPALEQIIEEMKGLSSLSAGELAKGRALLETNNVDNFGSGDGAAWAFAQLALSGQSPDTYAKLPSELAAVTSEQVVNVTQVFAPERFTVVLVGDRAQIEKSLKQKFPHQAIVWKAASR